MTQALRYTELNTGVKPKGNDGPYFISNVSGGLQALQALAGAPIDGPVPLTKAAIGSKT